jgi:ribosomal protein S12 methylthiotransferase accessory factor
MLEGLERYAGLRARGKTVSVFGSYKQLASDALDPQTCGLYSKAFYEETYPAFVPFSPEQQLSWVWGYSFGQQRPVLIPEQLAYYMDYRKDVQLFVKDCSNGCAIGGSLEEAILFGLLELIERDAFLMSWYARLSPRRIDPRSCRDAEIQHLLNRIDWLGYDVYLLDTRLDIGIPSVTAVGVLREDKLGKLVLAAGCGLEPEQAIRGALSEIASYIPNLVFRMEKKLDDLEAMAQDYRKVQIIHDHATLYGLPKMFEQASFLLKNPTLHAMEDLYAQWMQERPRNLDLKDDVQYCIDTMLRLGLDVLVVDQTCPEQERVGLKTVGVIVPGLLPIDFGWNRIRGLDFPRLREVPRLAGYLSEDFDPANCNLTPHPFP